MISKSIELYPNSIKTDRLSVDQLFLLDSFRSHSTRTIKTFLKNLLFNLKVVAQEPSVPI